MTACFLLRIQPQVNTARIFDNLEVTFDLMCSEIIAHLMISQCVFECTSHKP
jgi:hypothetical protein